jgi:hypothetical protein
MMMYKRGDEGFDVALDKLEKKFFHNAGGPDAEEIWNRNKRELKEDKWISFYGTNSQIAHMIKRNRLDIKAVRVMSDGAELYYDPDAIKAFYTLVRLRD